MHGIGLMVACALLSAHARAIGDFIHIADGSIGWELKDGDLYFVDLHL
jgi:hypothetical protein